MKRTSLLTLVSRCGPDCWICGIPCDIRPDPHPRLVITRDHIHPRSHGGTAKPNNILPAHQYCNVKRGNREVTHELRTACRVWVEREGGSAIPDILLAAATVAATHKRPQVSGRGRKVKRDVLRSMDGGWD